jgi:hypothetical protein
MAVLEDAVEVVVASEVTEAGSRSLADVMEIVREHFGDGICRAVKAALGVIGSLSLKKRDNCLVLVYEGSSGTGKSTTVRIVTPESGERAERFLERSDNFTPASFVSQAANRTSEELEEIDLLPKLQDKVLLTKELAPLFGGNRDSLLEIFARLTTILDGNGYVSHSGTHGRRGVSGRYVFNWLGATTPISREHTSGHGATGE